MVLCVENGDFRTKIACLYGSKTSSVILCMQNSVPSISLYRSQPSSVVFGCKTATLGPDLQVCMGPRPHLSFCACKTAWLAPELLVSMGPCPHLWLLHAKQRILVQSTSLYGYQTSLVILCMQNGVIYTRMTSLYGFQPSSVILCLQNRDFKTDVQVCMGPSPHL